MAENEKQRRLSLVQFFHLVEFCPETLNHILDLCFPTSIDRCEACMMYGVAWNIESLDYDYHLHSIAMLACW